MQIPFTKLQDQYKDCKDQINTAIQKILDTDEFIAAMEKAETKCKINNSEGEKLKQTFTYENTLNKILE